ncbi:MAG: biopolymer transporter Tol [Kiritimatiellia bacterium]
MRKALMLLLAICLWSTGASAQVRVTKGMTDASLLDVSGFKASGTGELFRQTLEANLVRSGWFQIITAGRAEFTVVGTAEDSGGNLSVRCEAYNVITRERHFGKSYRSPSADARQMAHRVADEIIKALTGREGISSTKIVMVGNRSGKKELYICDADGQNLRQLTRDNSLSMSPKWSPDARQIVYTSFLSFFPDVYLITLASGERRRIANYPGLNSSAAIAPNGRELALTLSQEGSPGIYIKDLRSGRLTRLTTSRRAAEASPSWAPDGQRLVFVSDVAGSPQLYLINRQGGDPRRITSSGAENVDPDWGSNGFIAYATRVGRQYHVCVLNPETLAFRQISSGSGDFEDPSWAPDGRHIVCTHTVNRRSRLFILDTMSDLRVSLLPDSEAGDWFSPAWSPK